MPLAKLRFDDVKAPLKADAVFTCTLPAPVNTVPALKMLLPPKTMVPVCASTVPLLTMFKAVKSPISVMPVPPLLRSVPLLMNVLAAPPP